MNIFEGLLPQEAITEGESFRGGFGKSFYTTETNFHGYISSFQEKLVEEGISFSDDDFESIQMSAALIDALARTRITKTSGLNVLEHNQHAFNIFYRTSGSEEWKLQFANSVYLANFGANLSEKLETPASKLMSEVYTPETIEGFTNESGYTSKFIEMDKLPVNDDGDKPAFFWYKKQFNHPHGGQIEVRIGMNGTGLSEEQRMMLTNIYNFTDTVRSEYIDLVHYAQPSSDALIVRLKGQISSIFEHNSAKDNTLAIELSWLLMFLEMANDIIKNSPFPLTIVDKQGSIKRVSPAYAAMVGYTVDEIIKPGFFNKIYPGIEGDLVRESIEFYTKNGYYPEDASFIVNRGKEFYGLEKQNNLPSLGSLELIPSPYTFDGGTIRLNTARPHESIAHLL
ncbi:MAG: PAS domain S-box protein [Candidatus Gracilibacteria bacterium]|nr:PAS domain S-box protein [Candidatus Gracilibacteria bacterium]